ncbi:hypothetical protein MKK68_02185 [Methylobacterium sp. E-016]|uniref:DUF6634 family protein n=1 Tax=Methylobacterium sp. E-016 TaxID=2836556 RepID=UPI001FBA1DD2|nr:DUF6634 family protein [Methylobacterium sp. E-016]MCJ2074470.1 hypothetical protein [Methylobacterium sp. E-016]
MRLRDLTPSELTAVALRRDRVRAALSGRADAPTDAEIDRAPYMRDWIERSYPGTDKPCLHGETWGHPILGNTFVTTSVIQERGPGWCRTYSGTLYILGSECRDARLARRSAQAIEQAALLAEAVASTGYRP